MAIYHLSMKAICRSAGRSSTAAAAYRAGCAITDTRTGEIHDYRRKRGVESAEIVMPDGVSQMLRDDLWNGVELHHKRGDATVAREFEVALPAELSAEDRRQLAIDFAREVTNHYGVAADVCIHEPSKEGDQRNYHAHILFSACTISKAGFGNKAAELDPIHCKKHRLSTPADLWRERWADLVNERLEKNNVAARVDHRSLEAQGVQREPTVHLGPSVTEMDRRGVETKVQKRIAEQVADRLQLAKELALQIAETVKQIAQVTAQIMQDKLSAIQQGMQGGTLAFEGAQITEGDMHQNKSAEELKKQVDRLKDELASTAKKPDQPKRPSFTDFAKSIQEEKRKEKSEPPQPKRGSDNDYDVEI